MRLNTYQKKSSRIYAALIALLSAAILLIGLTQFNSISAQDASDPSIPLSHITPVVWEGRGNGDSLSPSFDLSAGVVVVDVNYVGTSFSILEIEFLKTDGSDSHRLLFKFIPEGGEYSGGHALNVYSGLAELSPGSYRIQISSAGNWNVDVSQPQRETGIELPRFVQGSGDGGSFPFSFRPGLVPILYEYSGPADGSASLFGVQLYKMDGSEREIVFFEFLTADEVPKSGLESVTVHESFTGDITPGVYLLRVQSEGDWKIALGAESFTTPTSTPVAPTVTPTAVPTGTTVPTHTPTSTAVAPTFTPTAVPTGTTVPTHTPTSTTVAPTFTPTAVPTGTTVPTHTPTSTAIPPTVPDQVLNRLSAVETLVATLQRLISALDAKIAALDARIATLEAEDASRPEHTPTAAPVGLTPTPTPTPTPTTGEPSEPTPTPSPTPMPIADDCTEAITPGISLDGIWNSDCEASSLSQEGGVRYARYFIFTLNTASDVTIELTSDEDTYLYLKEGRGRDGAVLNENDDIDAASGIRDSRIQANLQPGRYTIEATTYDPQIAGAFQISLSIR